MPLQRISDQARLWFIDKGTGWGDYLLVDPLPGDRANVLPIARWSCGSGLNYDILPHEIATADHWSTMQRVLSNLVPIGPERARIILADCPHYHERKAP